MKTYILLAALALADSCGSEPTSDDTQRAQQETILQAATASVGMPNIHNFRERRLVKTIYELRDDDGLVTYTYTFSEATGRYTFFCDSIGYGVPYSTQYTNPEKIARCNSTGPEHVIPQADPNGLFSPSSAEGTWVMCKDPNGTEARPVYIEPKIIVSPFKLPTTISQ